MFKPWYKQLINVDSSLSTCASTVYHCSIIVSFAFSAITSRFLTELLKGDTDMVSSYYRVVHTLLATLLCLASYEQRSTRLLKVLHKCYNTDILRVLLIYPNSPSDTVRPWDCAYIYIYIYQSNPSLPCYNILCMYVCMYACMHVCTYARMHVCIYVHAHVTYTV